ncbi:5'-nucleotidase [mine drainage metagenome]|uniref:5'-deoxynucleotidase n=1 Tax=mine drainage metagenome TaxID=410659 RepID=A0A1J5RT23_9ZZZZ
MESVALHSTNLCNHRVITALFPSFSSVQEIVFDELQTSSAIASARRSDFLAGMSDQTALSPVAQRLARQIEFIVEVDRLKEIFRQTILTQSRRAENDAEHSWHLCLCAIVLAEHARERDLNLLRVLKMVIIHDLVEIDAGDTFAYDTAGMANQHEREAKAADRIFGLLPEDQAREFRALWDEFEERKTPESKFAAAVDRFQPMLLNVRTQGHAWKKHGVTQPRVLARNRHIEEGCPELWAYAQRMVAGAVERGDLAPG